MNELISIIVPVYNVEKYINDCIDSLINQTYPNIEILLIDDGSTDNSGHICDVYDKSYKNIFSFHKKNGGLSDARNFGIKNANGNYLMFVDSDDFLDLNVVNDLYKAIIQNDSEIAICNIMKINEFKKETPFYFPTNTPIILEGTERFQTLEQPSVCNKLFKKQLFDNVEFPVGKYYEDTFVYHELAFSAKRISLTGTTGYYYRTRENSIIQTSNNNIKYFDFIEAVYCRAKFLINKNIEEYAIQACLSLYAAYNTAIKTIPLNDQTQKYFKICKNQYNLAYIFLIRSKSRCSLKQRIRLIILKYLPKLHSKLF